MSYIVVVVVCGGGGSKWLGQEDEKGDIESMNCSGCGGSGTLWDLVYRSSGGEWKGWFGVAWRNG